MMSQKLYAVAIAALMAVPAMAANPVVAGQKKADQKAPELSNETLNVASADESSVPRPGQPVAANKEGSKGAASAISAIVKTVLPAVSQQQAADPACDDRTADGLPLGCPIALKPTDEKTPDGISMYELPLASVADDIRAMHEDGWATETVQFAKPADQKDPKNVLVQYEACQTVGPNDRGDHCQSLEVPFSEFNYNSENQTILLDGRVVAQYHNANARFILAPLYKKDARLLEGWDLAQGVKLAPLWSKDGQLQVGLVAADAR